MSCIRNGGILGRRVERPRPTLDKTNRPEAASLARVRATLPRVFGRLRRRGETVLRPARAHNREEHRSRQSETEEQQHGKAKLARLPGRPSSPHER